MLSFSPTLFPGRAVPPSLVAADRAVCTGAHPWAVCLLWQQLKELEEVLGLLFKAELTPGGLCSGDSLGMSLERSPAALRLFLPTWSTSPAPGDSL